jgi:hypothetical protein
VYLLFWNSRGSRYINSRSLPEPGFNLLYPTLLRYGPSSASRQNCFISILFTGIGIRVPVWLVGVELHQMTLFVKLPKLGKVLSGVERLQETFTSSRPSRNALVSPAHAGERVP